jgi:hypothetical protein
MEAKEKNSWNPDFDSNLKGNYLLCKLDNLSGVSYGSCQKSSLNQNFCATEYRLMR